MTAPEDYPKSMAGQISPPALPHASLYPAGDPIRTVAFLAPRILSADIRTLLDHSFPRGKAAKIDL